MVPYISAGRHACHHHVVNRNVPQHVAVVIVRHLTPILFVLFLQHGSRARQLFGESADPAYLVFFDGWRRHRWGGQRNSDGELAMPMPMWPVLIEVRPKIAGMEESWESQAPVDFMPWNELTFEPRRPISRRVKKKYVVECAIRLKVKVGLVCKPFRSRLHVARASWTQQLAAIQVVNTEVNTESGWNRVFIRGFHGLPKRLAMVWSIFSREPVRAS